ncbi:MAG: hypothetical protein AVDCRST_MAG15-2754 [uncultured Rubellimicrobium sp.]|uniref:Uncharacterized protein n=1 Tax=uncultured Rubellimicrobium sp. TaxID=543078 RepID=A0A6J4PYN0_9RHOB|nr:MAG: hypothetical protein AVDCRST_MAG15-2754 [uncultured Rubellimicrobium sp.]
MAGKSFDPMRKDLSNGVLTDRGFASLHDDHRYDILGRGTTGLPGALAATPRPATTCTSGRRFSSYQG